MRDYKLEVWITFICFIVVFIIGGTISSVFVLGLDFFYEAVSDGFYVARHSIMGFPLPYFLMVVLCWIGSTIIGIIWCLVMDRLEERQKS